MRTIFLTLAMGLGLMSNAQHIMQLDTVQFEGELDGIGVAKIDSDSLCSNFLIWVEEEVPLHRHNEHSETVIVLEGEGEFTLGDTVTAIGQGDYIFIPMGTPHAVVVTSDIPLKVLSIQAPEFDGSDREAIRE